MQNFSNVERAFLDLSAKQSIYEGERIPLVEVLDYASLGKLVALRFLEWALRNPLGVIALPTGKTPESFINSLKYYKENWFDPKVQKELLQYKIKSKTFPDTSNLKFVQIDEYFPIHSKDKNSFLRFVQENYLSVLDIKKENILTIDIEKFVDVPFEDIQDIFDGIQVDISLINREPSNSKEQSQKEVLLAVDKACLEYEEQIKSVGGIGFFLGGIGPDGHVAFNMSGSDFDSRTRLVKLNYESVVAAAKDFGGILKARNKAAITIGLKTITQNPDATIIIIANGLKKSEIVAKAVEGKEFQDVPASILQGCKNARFYITKDAASKLYGRRAFELENLKSLDANVLDEIIYDVAQASKKPINKLVKDDFFKTQKGLVLLKLGFDILDEAAKSYDRLVSKVESDQSNLRGHRILHTAPHPDDIMLSYYSYISDLKSCNDNFFAYFTNGFNAVSDSYLKRELEELNSFDFERYQKELFDWSYEQILDAFVKAYKSDDLVLIKQFKKIIFLHLLIKQFDVLGLNDLSYFLKELSNLDKFSSKLTGFKGALRESEVDRLWLLNGARLDQIYHLRSKFYENGGRIDADLSSMSDFLNKLDPSVVFLALDPKGIGPGTHYKSLQLMTKVLSNIENEDLPVYGYRNVWSRFNLYDANVLIPVLYNQQDELNKAFVSCFSTQKEADFPSPKFDGPFSNLACQIQKDQFELVKSLLGDEFFKNHENLNIRNASGFIFLKRMSLNRFTSQNHDDFCFV